MKPTKQEFIKKWSSWWRLRPRHEELTIAFESELNELIQNNGGSLPLSESKITVTYLDLWYDVRDADILEGDLTKDDCEKLVRWIVKRISKGYNTEIK